MSSRSCWFDHPSQSSALANVLDAVPASAPTAPTRPRKPRLEISFDMAFSPSAVRVVTIGSMNRVFAARAHVPGLRKTIGSISRKLPNAPNAIRPLARRSINCRSGQKPWRSLGYGWFPRRLKPPLYDSSYRRSSDGGRSRPSTIQMSDRALAIDVASVRSLAMGTPRML